MRKSILLGAAVGAVLVFGSAGGAFAGEFNGNGDPTQGPAHSNSWCAYSGLQDWPQVHGEVQNWGHIPKAARDVISDRGAAVVDNPEGLNGCNAVLSPKP